MIMRRRPGTAGGHPCEETRDQMQEVACARPWAQARPTACLSSVLDSMRLDASNFLPRRRPSARLPGLNAEKSDARAKGMTMAENDRLFQDHAGTVFEALKARGETQKFKKGDTIIRKGEGQGDLYLVLAGQLHVVDEQPKSAPRFLCGLETGDSFGEVSLLDAGPASATIRCVSSCQVLRVGRKAFEKFLNEDPVNGCRVVLRLGEILSRRLRRMNDRVSGVWSAYVQSIP
jgi:hypothetical protein